MELPPPVAVAPSPRRAPIAPPAPPAAPADPAPGGRRAGELADALLGALDAVLVGRREVSELAVATLLAGGNLLVEDVPGVGKTLLAQVLARASGGSFGRIQGTPDLLPGDVTGSMLPVDDGTGGHRLEFRPGPIFRHVVVFDELNRATPRTQSALLEAAEEGTVTVDGVTHPLPEPFTLVATQNPLEMAGTHVLGEGALDRFAAVLAPGRPERDAEVEVLTGRRGRSMLDAIEPVASITELVAARREVGRAHLGDAVAGYVADLLAATRAHPDARLGASTRAGVSLVALARARAVVHGRGYVVPDDVAALAVASLGHRVAVAGGGATTAGRRVVADCLAQVEPPTP